MRGPSRTVRRDLVVRVDLRLARDPGRNPVDLEAMAGLHRPVLLVLRPAGRVVLLDLLLTRQPGLVLPLGRVLLRLAVPVVPNGKRPVDRVAPARQVSLGLTDRVDLVVPVHLDRVGRAVPLDLADLADRVVPDLMAPVALAVLVVPVGLGLMGRVSLV
ncbi:MAG: hypothetical protein WA630_00340, partial [Mycobacterium sp.]